MDAIFKAILEGDEDALQRHLQHGLTPAVLNRAYRMHHSVQYVCRPGEMMTPLALAAGFGKTRCVALLLDSGAAPGFSRGEGNVEHWKTIPLHWACQNNQVDCAAKLLDAPGGAATIDAKVRGGLTPLGTAALEGSLGIVRLLIERGCNVNEPRDSGASPLYGACQEGHTEVVRLLVSAQANIHQVRTASGATPLFAAAGHGHPAVIKLLLAVRADMSTVAKDGETALSIARAAVRSCRGPDPRQCVALLEAHASRGAEALDVIEALDVNDSALPATATSRLVPVGASELVSLVRNGQALRLTELLTSRDSGAPAVSPSVLDAPAGHASDPPLPNGMRIGGRTPLVAACMLRSNFNLEVVRLILDAKASVDQKARDEGACFPLMAGLHNFTCVELLLSRGADVAQTDGAEYSPLLAACEWGLHEAAAALLAHGANPAFEGRERGYTPLVAAAIGGKTQCVQLLLLAGVDPKSPRCSKAGAPGQRQVPREGLDALGWAWHLHRHAPPEMTSDFDQITKMLGEFEQFFGYAQELGVVTDGEYAALVERIVAAPPTERFGLRASLVEKYMGRVNEAKREQWRANMRVCRERRLRFESDPTAAAAMELYPAGVVPVFGGRARLCNLSKAPTLNGEVGSIVSFNADGKRRFGLKLKADKVLSVLPANLTAVDARGFTTCAASSAEVCDALRETFTSVGQGNVTVVDWTPLAAKAEMDPANLHEMGLSSHLLNLNEACDQGAAELDAPPTRAYYVQRTAETESFFLTCRELMEAHGGSINSMGSGAVTMPWLLYLDTPRMNILNPAGDFSAEVAYIARLCSNSLASDVTCPVCMEGLNIKESPSQLPCAHFLCYTCQKKLFPIKQIGLKCPVCQRNHARYSLLEMNEAPGGIAIAELPLLP